MRLSENIQHIRPSATLAVAALAREMKAAGRPVIDLSAGQPDSGTPDFIAEAGIEAIRTGQTRYAPAPGLPELRSAIAGDLARLHGVDTSPAGVVVSAGAKQALFNALFSLIGPGERVLIPSPFWTSYPFLVHLARGEPVEVRGLEERDFRVSVDQLEQASDPRTRALLINSPSNPTGAVYTLDELRAIAEWAHERGVWLISDEIYARIFFGADRAPGVLDLPGELLERVVLVGGASKAFAMTGWRIGYTYGSAELAAALAAVQSHITTSAATMCQVAATAAYGEHERQDRAVAELREAFRRRRDRLVELFESELPGVGYVRPEGAFYLFFRVDGSFREDDDGSVGLCRRLLEEAEVALVPGAAFGDDRYVRLSFAASDADIEEGVRRLGRALRRPPG